MAYATDTERLELVNANLAFGLQFVVRVEKTGRQSELPADDVDHALALSGAWLTAHGADYVEVFRVDQNTGALIATLGPSFREG